MSHNKNIIMKGMREDMIKIVRYIYNKYYKGYADEWFTKIFNMHKELLFEGLKDNFDEILENHLYEYGLKVILQDFHNTFEYFDEEKDYYYKKYLNTETNFTERNADFNKKYLNILKYFFDYLDSMIHNLYIYKNEISKQFQVNIFRINHIEITNGDSHNYGKRVAIITIDDTNIVYKPRNMSSDLFYYKIISLFNEATGSNVMVPNLLVKENFSLQEFFECEERVCKDRREVKNYYYELGIHCFFLYILSATDIHYENIIAYGCHPIIIDLETLFQEAINIGNGATSNLIESTVLYTLLFDFSSNYYGNVETSMGGIGNYTEKVYAADTIVNEDEDEIHIIKECKHIESHNLPIYLDKVQPSYYFMQEFINGFEVAYVFFEQNKELIKNQIQNIKAMNVRVVVRPTYVYARFLEALKEPIGYTQRREKGIFKILNNSDKYSTYHEKIFADECDALQRRDVPYFYMSIDEKDLSILSCDSKRYLYTPRDYILKKINMVSRRDIEYQISIIQMIWACNFDNDNIEVLNTKKPVKIRFESKDMRGVIFEFLEWIKGLSSNREYWQSLSIRYDSKGTAIVSPLNYGIYDGLCGIGLFLEAAFKSAAISNKDIIHKVENSIEITYENNSSLDTWSIYHGKFSYIRYWWLKYKMGNEMNEKAWKELIMLCDILRKELQTNEFLPRDYIGGLAGVVSLLSDIYNEIDNKRENIKNTIIDSVYYILKPVLKEGKSYIPCDFNKEKYVAGFAHGLTGIVYGISKAIYNIKELQDKEIITILVNLLKTENKLFDEEKLIWLDNRNEEKRESLTTWCSGAAGILLGREEINRLNIGIKADKIKETRNIVLEKSYTKGYGNSLCHGSIGNLMIIKYLSLYDEHLSGYADELVRDLEEDYLKNGIQTGYKYNNPSLSFFLGIPGEIYGLIYYYYDINIPMILL